MTYDTLYRKFHMQVLRLVRRRTPLQGYDDDSRHDMVQAIFATLIAARFLDRWDRAQPIEGYFFRAANNALSNEMRRRCRHDQEYAATRYDHDITLLRMAREPFAQELAAQLVFTPLPRDLAIEMSDGECSAARAINRRKQRESWHAMKRARRAA